MSISIITPCYRQANLHAIYKSINFDLICKWIVVYDTSKNRSYSKLFSHAQIVEVECSYEGINGNAQRNYGMNLVKDGFIYFLDDDNIVHPGFWELVPTLDPQYFYTWDQLRNKNGDETDWALFSNEKGRILKGNVVKVQKIDTAQFLVPKSLVYCLVWNTDDYKADGIFIESVYTLSPWAHKYIPKVLCYYNYLE